MKDIYIYIYKSENIKTNLKQNYNEVYNALKLIKSQIIKILFLRIRENLANLSF